MERLRFQCRAHSDLFPEIMMQAMTNPDFNDIVLVAEKNIAMKANKLILSAASPYLRNRIKDLKSNGAGYPDEIRLPGIRFEVLSNILQYIYYGKTMVEKAHHEAFLSACRELEIQIQNPVPELAGPSSLKKREITMGGGSEKIKTSLNEEGILSQVQTPLSMVKSQMPSGINLNFHNYSNVTFVFNATNPRK